MGTKAKSDSSSSKMDKKALKQAKKEAAAAALKAAEEAARKAAELAKKAEEESDDSSDDDDDDDDDDDESSSSEEEEEVAPVKKVADKKKKEEESSDSSDSDDDDDDSDEEEEKPKKAEPKKADSKKATALKEESDSDESSSDSDDDDDSDEEEEEEEEKPVPAANKKAEVKKETKKDESDDSDDDSSDDDSTDSSDVPDEAEEESNKKRKAPETVADETPAAKKAAVSDANTKVYVRGLPWRATEDEIRDWFSSCGPIVSCEMPLQDDGRSSGTAIIEFETEEAAASAIARNGEDFQGRWLSIKESTPKSNMAQETQRQPSEKPEGCKTVFVGNLAWDVDEDTLRQAFADCGEITSVRFAMDRETQEFKGFGHIEFELSESTEAAMKMAGTDILGRAVRVDYAADRQQRPAFGAGGGRGGGRGGFGGGRGGGGRGAGGGGRGGGRGGGGRGGPSPSGAKKFGSISEFKGTKVTFD